MTDHDMHPCPDQQIARHQGVIFAFCRRVLLPFVYMGMALLLSRSALAQQPLLKEPFMVRNQNPFILVYGLPGSTAADLLPMDESSLQLHLDMSNFSKTSNAPQEQVTLDGETYRMAMNYSRGLGGGWQVGVELPVIAQRPGFMDNFIEQWHDIFGLTNSDREPWPRNRLLFNYTRDGIVEAEMTEGSTGVGDLQLQIARSLITSEEGNRVAMHAALKLPTGDAERFQGSGSIDLALWLSGASPVLFEQWRIGGYLQAGLLLLGEGDLLPDRQRSRVWFGGVGVHWRLWSWLMLKAQLDAHGSFYKSQLPQLGDRSVMLTVGGSIPVARWGGVVDLAIGENLTTDTVPDFTLNLAYRQRF
jgi:hypothetical protein